MRLRRPLRREVIGQSERPILHRWTLLDRGSWKLMLHHFLPTSRDRDYHDHPRPFWTFVLRGEYLDIAVVAVGEYSTQIYPERMRAGTLRYRPARHTHTTMAGPRGAWTLVLMGPLRRPWGFIRDGAWWPWREYEARFGHGFRCEEPTHEPEEQ